MSSSSTRFGDKPRPRLLLSAFVMNTPSHITGGTWRYPEEQQHRYNDLDFWVDVARRLEDAKFDTIFFADVVGLYGEKIINSAVRNPGSSPFAQTETSFAECIKGTLSGRIPEKA